MTHSNSPTSTPAADAGALERVMFEIKRVIVGQERLVERMMISLLARGHCLLEGVPGVAKTLAVETLARTVSGSFARVQFTPDLVPSDIVGTRIYRPNSERFDTELGPVMANFVLADEINRAPAKVQSAMLEVMAEGHVTIGGQRFDVPQPFLVLATQNPIESEGVYPLPEAQRDRFLMKISIDYPTTAEEREIVYRMGVEPPVANAVISTDELSRLQQVAGRVFVHHAIVDYVVRLVVSTRHPAEHGMHDVASWVAYGASPRASLGLIAAGRGMALLRGRDYVLPQDILDIAGDVLAHRLVLSYDAIADGVPAAHAVRRVLQTVPLPQVAPRQRANGPATRVRQPPRSSRWCTARRPRRSSRTRGANAPRDRAPPMTGPTPVDHGPALDLGPSEALLRRLELTVRNRLDGLLQGNYVGLVPGPGSEAGESRQYTPGDDVRRMDWPVTARTTVPHVRQTIADRELETWLVVDLSPSMDFGTGLTEKRELVLAAITAVVHLTVRGGNRIGALVANGTESFHIPALGGRNHGRHLIRRIAATRRAERGGGAELPDLLESLRRPPRRRGLVAVVSDFIGPVTTGELAVGTAAARTGVAAPAARHRSARPA